MELEDRNQSARRVKTGRQTLEITAGKTLKIETSPNGIDILNETVPEGKVWAITLNISVIEINA